MSLILLAAQIPHLISPPTAIQQSPLDIGTTLLAALAIVGLGGIIVLLLMIIQRDEALRNSEVRYRTLVETAIDGIIMIDQESIIRAFNPASERIFGYTAAEVIGLGIECLMPPPYREAYKGAFSNFLQSGQTNFIGQERETVGLRKDGSSFPARMSITEARVGSQRFFTGVIRDVTQQKQAEQAEREQRVLAESLRDVAATLNSSLHLDEVAKLILSSVGRVVPHDASSVMLVEAGEARILAAHGYPTESENETALPDYSLSVTETHTLREMVRSKQPLILNSSEDAADWISYLEIGWGRSYIGAPITRGQQVIGFLNLHSQSPGYFTAAHAEKLKAFANQAAIAIDNARLYNELEAYSGFLMEAIEKRTAELERSKDRVETILNNSPDAILLLTVDGIIQTGNTALHNLFGYRADEVTGQKMLLLATPAHHDVVRAMFAAVLQGNSKGRVEIVAQRKDGTMFDADIVLSCVRGQDGIEGAIGILRDISVLKEVGRMKDAFVSNVSHQLRTPVTSFKLFLGLLRKLPPEDHAEVLDMLAMEANRLQRTIEDVLRLSRLDQGREGLTLTTVDLNALAAQCVSEQRTVAESRELRLTLRNKVDLPPVQADEGLLEQVMDILLTNALNYTPPGGRITVRTYLRHRHEKTWAGFSVRDTGPGILPEEREYLFERFFRGSAGRESVVSGTGLGLTIAREIVIRHGGSIDVESKGAPGKGALFSVWLPLDVDQAALNT